jgi:hypothetical protein
MRERQESDLTVSSVPNIIDCTSLLRRANKPAVLCSAGYQGWRQNIFLLPAELFPHWEKA